VTAIKEGTEVYFENLLSIRKKVFQTEIQKELIGIAEHMKKNQAMKAGPLITSTFSSSIVNGLHLLDMEIMIPINKVIYDEEDYTLKKKFHLVNAVTCRHVGNPETIQNTYDSLINYISDKQLQQITAAYNVYEKDSSEIVSLDDMIIAVYIGVNPSVL